MLGLLMSRNMSSLWSITHRMVRFPLLHVYIESELTQKQCLVLAVKLSSSKHLPKECLEYKDVVQVLQKRPTKSDNSIAFQGMGSSGLAAAKARERGQQNYAQIQRRFTNTRRFSKNNDWSHQFLLNRTVIPGWTEMIFRR